MKMTESCPKLGADISFWKHKNLHAYLSQQQCWHVIFTTLRISLWTVLLHRFENLRNKPIQEHDIYSVIIVVLCLLCDSDLYLTLPVCLDSTTSFKPQSASSSWSLILPQWHERPKISTQMLSVTPSKVILYVRTLMQKRVHRQIDMLKRLSGLQASKQTQGGVTLQQRCKTKASISFL